jgi:hypothetical protein
MRKYAMTGAATAALLAATGPATAAMHGAQVHKVKQTMHTHQTSVTAKGTTDKGGVSGDPFGKGKVVLRSEPAGAKFRVHITETFAGGKVKGTVVVDYTLTGDGADFVGTGRWTGGTGKYAGASGKIKRFTGHGSTNGKGTWHVVGKASY